MGVVWCGARESCSLGPCAKNPIRIILVDGGLVIQPWRAVNPDIGMEPFVCEVGGTLLPLPHYVCVTGQEDRDRFTCSVLSAPADGNDGRISADLVFPGSLYSGRAQ